MSWESRESDPIVANLLRPTRRWTELGLMRSMACRGDS